MTGEVFIISDLIVKHLRGELDEKGQAALNEWLVRPGNRQFLHELSKESNIREKLNRLHNIDIEPIRQKAYEKLFPGLIGINVKRKIGWQKYLVAASVVMLTFIGIWLAVTGPFKRSDQPSVKVEEIIQDEILPANKSAILVLADGSKIILDSMRNGAQLNQGNSLVTKKEGQVSYMPGQKAVEAVYNTLQTEKGKRYELMLPDESKVWLNSESSVVFPSAFIGKSRKVTITGEAYFEIAENASRPFIVHVGDMEIEVLGTHFNVMAYGNELSVKTTLAEGNVRVRYGNNSVNLQPNQQAVLEPSGRIIVEENANIEEALACKNGLFYFERASIDDVMRQVQRWYNVDIVYEGSINRKFHVDISRGVSLSKLLKMLEETGWLKFRLEGKKLTVIATS
jgi:transmembrane sensor